MQPSAISTEVGRHVIAMFLGLAGAYLLGLGVFWLDIEVFSRHVLDALPSGAVGAVDALYGVFLDVQRPLCNMTF